MASNLVRRAHQLLGASTHPRAKQRVAAQLAREFPAYEQHEVWGAVGLGPTEAKPPPLYVEHLNPHEVRTRVDPRPDHPPKHPTVAEAKKALREAGVTTWRPRTRKPKGESWADMLDELADDPNDTGWANLVEGRTEAERAAQKARLRAEHAAEAAARALERATRAANKAAHLARRARVEERAVRREIADRS